MAVSDKAVLEFEQVRLDGEASAGNGASPVQFLIRSGELVIVRLADNAYARSFADVAQGLQIPQVGQIRFQGENWRDMTAAQANLLRGRIGRICPDFAWISSLSLEENVALSQRHHTRRPAWDIRAEARRWAQAFGLPKGLPSSAIADLPLDVLRRSACVRAFVGDPALVIVQVPAQNPWIQLMPPLLDACDFIRGRQSAILWLTDATTDVLSDRLEPTFVISQ